jgi:outer membrane protein assembly factor BamB
MFHLIKEFNLDGVRDVAFHNEKMYTIQKEPFVRVFDLDGYDLIEEKALKGVTEPEYINSSYLVVVGDYGGSTFIYDVDSVSLLREMLFSNVLWPIISEDNHLLTYDRQEKKTKLLDVGDLRTVWSSDFERVGRCRAMHNEKFYATHFMNDQKVSCIDWGTGQLLWSFLVQDHFEKGMSVNRILGVFQDLLLVSLYKAADDYGDPAMGKVVGINPKDGALIKVLLDQPAPRFFDREKGLLFNIAYDTYWEYDLKTDTINTVNLWEKYNFEQKHEFVSLHSSFNEDYIFAFNVRYIGEDDVDRRYSVIDRESLDLLWEHKCSKPQDDAPSKYSALPKYYGGRLYIFWEEHLWIYEKA